MWRGLQGFLLSASLVCLKPDYIHQRPSNVCLRPDYIHQRLSNVCLRPDYIRQHLSNVCLRPRSLSVLRLMFVLMQNTHKKIIQIGQDYTFLSIISPYTKRKTQRRLRLKAIHTSTHSPCTAPKPRSIKRRKPMTSLIIPNTGSTVDLRWA